MRRTPGCYASHPWLLRMAPRAATLRTLPRHAMHAGPPCVAPLAATHGATDTDASHLRLARYGCRVVTSRAPGCEAIETDARGFGSRDRTLCGAGTDVSEC